MRPLVLVTGSSKGIGAETIKKFSCNNFDVIINYNTNKELAEDLKKQINNVNVYVEKFDITNEQEVKNIFNKYDIDILINNASLSIDSEMDKKTKQDFLRVLEVNLYGTFLMCKTFIESSKDGTIVNVSSTDAIDTYNILSIDYSASKAGIINITKNLALNYKNFKICAICPNWVNTESVQEMDIEYLKMEMLRVGQKELLTPSFIANNIYQIALNDSIKSGEIVRVDYE